MYRNWIIVFLLLLVLGIPFLLKQEGLSLSGGDEQLVIITPHNEALRYEFTRAFKQWYLEKRGKTIDIDWRVPGGSQECVRLVDSIYENAFKNYWEDILKRDWTFEVQQKFKMRHTLGAEDPLFLAFKDSDVSCGIDLFFGGGKVDIVNQAKKGNIIPSGIFQLHPEWFQDDVIPYSFGGNNFWDKGKCWVGTALSGFGVIFNRDSLLKLGYQEPELHNWKDLAADKLYGSVALTDPTGSGIFTMMFEIILQQQMQKVLRKQTGKEYIAKEDLRYWELMDLGWNEGLKLIQKISGNGRYFTDAATQPVLDVSIGDCAAGMTVDFYGLFQEESLRLRSGSQRFSFVMPEDGNVVSPDPIAMFRGAPNKQAALDFIEFVLSVDGQKLWDYKIGAPGGPVLYALSRPPIRKELYNKEHLEYRLHPDLNVYDSVSGFMYYPEWTGPLFKEIRFAMSVAFVDVHPELTKARKAIIEARDEGRNQDADLAESVMQQFESITYSSMWNVIKKTLNSGNPLGEIQLRTRISRQFREQYEKAFIIASAGRKEEVLHD